MKKLFENKNWERDLNFAKHEILIKITTVHSIVDDVDVMTAIKDMNNTIIIQKIEVERGR